MTIGDEGGFGNALKDDPESEYLAFNESENIPAVVTLDHEQRSCRTGVANRYAAIRIEVDTDLVCEILGMLDKECSSQETEKDT